jgi:hypothetical protein
MTEYWRTIAEITSYLTFTFIWLGANTFGIIFKPLVFICIFIIAFALFKVVLSKEK